MAAEERQSTETNGSSTLQVEDWPRSTQQLESNNEKSSRLKNKHLFGGLAILLASVVLTALTVYYLTTSANPTRRVPVRKEPPNPVEPLPPSNSATHAFKKAAVCSDGAPCSQIGRNILEKNGSAVDATLAAMLCNGVFNSQSMGLGGGFIMTIYERSSKKAYSLVARESAPLKATKDMFTKNATAATDGPLASGVPGELRGYWEAWKRFGRLPWEEVVSPAAKLCRDGYFMSHHQYVSLQFRPKHLIEADPNLKEWFIHPSTGELLTTGTLIRPTNLCKTLEIIAKEGGDALYNGSLADIFVEDVQELGGIITKEDMEKKQAIWREPVVSSLRGGKTLYTSPAPGGGPILAFILNILEGYNMTEKSIANLNSSILTTHHIVEAFKHAYAWRTKLADPDFVDVNELVKNLTSKEFAESIRKLIRDDTTFNDASHYGAIYHSKEDHGTAHLAVMAPNGDAVSVTSTINLYFGAGVTSRRTGIILNSGMDDFSNPGLINYQNVPPSPNNFIQPGKMPLSSVSPTIITDSNGDVIMVIGAAGGTKITTAVAWVIMQYNWFNHTIKESVDASRVHHQLFPMEIIYEYGITEPMVEGLQKLGHKMSRYRDRGSVVCSLVQNNGTIYANADYRKKGEVYGMN